MHTDARTAAPVFARSPLDAVPCKTERARAALQQRETLPRARRLFLIMVDGRRPLRDLAEAARGLGIDDDALAAMVEDDLLRWQGAAPPAAPVAPTPARPAASLAAAKLYALDLAALMLPGQERMLRESGREATDAAGLRRWLEEVASHITERAGGERASVFLGKVGAMLPADFLQGAPRPG